MGHLSLKNWMEKPGSCGDDSAHGQLVFPKRRTSTMRLRNALSLAGVTSHHFRTIVGFRPEKVAKCGTPLEVVTDLREAEDEAMEPSSASSFQLGFGYTFALVCLRRSTPSCSAARSFYRSGFVQRSLAKLSRSSRLAGPVTSLPKSEHIKTQRVT